MTTTSSSSISMAPRRLDHLFALVHRLQELLRRLPSDPVLQKSALSVLDQAIVSGTAFVTTILLGGGGKLELGLYYLAWSIVGFSRGIQEQIVIAPYMIYWSRREPSQLPKYAGSALTHQMIYLVLCGIACAAIATTGWMMPRLSNTIGLMAIALPLLLLRDFIRQLSFSHLETKAALCIDIFICVTQLGTLAAFAYLEILSTELTIIVMAVACGLAALLWLFKKRQVFQADTKAIVSDWKTNWTFGRWALATYLLASTTPYFMPWVVAFARGEAETGTFGACTSIVGFANMFMMGLCNYLGPKAARAYASGGLEELKQTLRRSMRLYIVSLGLFSTAAFIVGEWVARTCYGSEFAGTGLIIGVMTLTVLANSIAICAGNGLWAMERPEANFRADLCAMFVTVVATLLLVPMFGGLGAALATFIGMSADAAVRWFTLTKLMRHAATMGGAA